MKNRLIMVLVLASMLIACGEEEVKTEEQTAEETVTVDNTPAAIITTSDLKSNADFSFTSSASLYLRLPASPSATVNYFINVCTDFSNENGIDKINYNSCKLRTLLTAHEQEFTLKLSTAESKLIAQIWPMKDGAEPITLYFNIQETGDNWHIAI